MTCSTQLGNTGFNTSPFCLTTIRRFVFVPTKDSSGALNSLSSSNALLKAEWQAKCDESNKLDRFYPTNRFKNVAPETSEPNVKEYDDQSTVFISDGVIVFNGVAPQLSPYVREQLNKFNGKEIGVNLIDDKGNIAYYDKDGDGTFYPIPLDKEALFHSKFMFAKDSDPSETDIQFQLQKGVKLDLIKVIDEDDLDFDALSYDDIYGLIDVNVTTSGITTTNITVELIDVFGADVEGLTASDVSLYNNTDSASVAVSSVTAQTGDPNKYDIAFTDQTAGDEMLIQFSLSRYDVPDTTVDIPT